MKPRGEHFHQERSMNVLFIGGTGIISSACSRLAVEHGVNLYLLNRGQSVRPPAPGANLLRADIRQPETVRAAIEGLHFDAVVDWIAFVPEQVETDLDLFRGRAEQYVFISSASAYQTPPALLPIRESTVLDNPFWAYSRNKIACEERLVRAYREEHYPVTIVRPSHTYDETLLPMDGGYTVVNRMLQGKPVIVPGDGSSLWTLTHNSDFAKGFVPLLGNPRAVGESFHITSDEWLTWDQIFRMVARAFGTEAKIRHVPSDLIAAHDPTWGASLLGDKTHSAVFDNHKIKQIAPEFRCSVPFARGIETVAAWYAADASRRRVNEELDRRHDLILEHYQAAWERI
jgi:nucleoside-diphosphate-sugar epimerase